MPVVDFAQFVTIREPDPVSWVHSAQKDFGLRCSCWKEYDALVGCSSTLQPCLSIISFAFSSRGGVVSWWSGHVGAVMCLRPCSFMVLPFLCADMYSIWFKAMRIKS